MKATIIRAITAGIALSSSLALASTESQVFDGKGLERLELNNTSGNAKIEVSTDGKAHVTATKIDFSSICSLTIDREGKAVVATVKALGLFSTGICKVNFAIKIPETLALDLEVGSGNISVNSTKGAIDFRAGSGDIELNDVESAKVVGRVGSGTIKAKGSIGSVDLKSGSGNIELSGLRGDTKIDTGSGDMKLTYNAVPQQGQAELKTGSGDTTVYLPPSTKVRTMFETGSGKLSTEIGDSPNAPFTVSVKSGSGNLKVKKLL